MPFSKFITSNIILKLFRYTHVPVSIQMHVELQGTHTMETMSSHKRI